MSQSVHPAPEFSRMIDLRQITEAPTVLEPDAAERRKLSGRFGITAIEAMRAEVQLDAAAGKVTAKGRLTASIVQACAISGEDFSVTIDEPLDMRFVPDAGPGTPDEEIELSADECDEIPYVGTAFDLGEAVAQSLALAIDPFAEGPEAERARKEHGLGGDVASGPFAALAALKKD